MEKPKPKDYEIASRILRRHTDQITNEFENEGIKILVLNYTFEYYKPHEIKVDLKTNTREIPITRMTGLYRIEWKD